MVKKNLKEWGLKLSHVEFSYNRAPTKAIGCSSFEALYGINRLTPIDLIPLPADWKGSNKAEKMVKEITKLHKQIIAYIEKINEIYKTMANKNRE